jgi:hypothetical protein
MISLRLACWHVCMAPFESSTWQWSMRMCMFVSSSSSSSTALAATQQQHDSWCAGEWNGLHSCVHDAAGRAAFSACVQIYVLKLTIICVKSEHASCLLLQLFLSVPSCACQLPAAVVCGCEVAFATIALVLRPLTASTTHSCCMPCP